MNILILNRKSLRSRPLCAWFPETDLRLFPVGDEQARDGLSNSQLEQHYAGFRFVKDYTETGEVEWEAENLHRQVGFDRIISLSERDVGRAATLRERWGLRGQSVESADAFRDKFVMKTIAEAAGIPIAPMAKIDGPIELFDFVDRFGLPVVVKPRTGAGSVGVRVVRSLSDMKAMIAETDGLFSQDAVDPLMVEKYIDGSLYHIDGLMQAGEVKAAWASRYLAGCLQVVQGKSNNGGIMLGAENPLNHELCELVAATVRALPCPEELTSFHAEVFQENISGALILCEIASRSGGGGIVEMHEAAWGLNINRASLRGQAGLVEPVEPWRSPHAHGFLCLATGRGYLRSAPKSCELAGIRQFHFGGEIGRCYNGPRSCIDGIIHALVEGGSEAEVETRLRHLEDWLAQSVVWGQEKPAQSGL